MSSSEGLPKVPAELPRIGNRFTRGLGRFVLSLFGWRIEGELPNLPKIVVAGAPHTSNWDFVIGLAVVFCLKLKISFFGKHSIFIPPFSALLKRWGGIPIERSRSHGVVEQMIGKVKQADKMLLCLAPEGTRSKISPWKSGFIHIARHANVPVFLIGLDYQHKTILFGPIFDPSNDTELEMEKVYEFYARVQPKYPSQVAYPAEKTIEE